MARIIKVGSTVTYRGAWGTAAPKQAQVQHIEKCSSRHEKYGTPVSQVEYGHHYNCTFDLSDGHWCYGDQIV